MLIKQNLDVTFTQGIDNKTDSKSNVGDSLQVLENAVFTKKGVLNKKSGSSLLSALDTDEATITDMKALLTYQENELLLAAGEVLYSYSDNAERWIEKGDLVSVSVDLKDKITNSYSQSSMTSCNANGISMYAWEDSRGGIRYSIQDDTTGTFFVNDKVLSAGGDTPQCIALGTSLMCLYGESTDLKSKYVSTGSPLVLESSTVRTNLHADHIFDVVNVGAKGYVFYKHSTAATAALIEVTSLGAVNNAITLSTTTIINTLSIYTCNNSNINYLSLVWKQTADLVKTAIYTTSFVNIVAAVTLDATVGTAVNKITQVRASTATTTIDVFYQTPGASRSNDLIRTNSVTLAGVIGTPAVFVRSLGIAAKAFSHNNKGYIPALHESTLQSTIFVLDKYGQVMTKLVAGSGGTHDSVGAFPGASIEKTTGVVSFLINKKGVIRSENATLFSLLGISEASVDFEIDNNYDSVELNRNLSIVGGVVSNYDGHSITEQGFHLYPEGMTATATATSGGFMSDGAYQYISVYQWTDAKGNIHRSAPSIAVSRTLSGGGSTQTNTMTVPTLRITRKTAPRAEVTLQLYRTEASGTIFYNVGSVSSPKFNDTTVDSVTIVDTLADATIISNEILYTTGGVLDNISAPAANIITTHTNRIFLAGLYDKNEIRYSKITRQGEGVAFNEGLAIQIDPRGGDITALASMDSNLVILKRDNIYTLAGEGPSDTGQGSTFTEPQLIVSNVGCISANTLVLGPDGLYFKSTKGIYHLSRGLEATYIGAPVEDYNQYNITSVTSLDDKNEIRFTTNNGYTLVYNYFFKQWSVFTNQSLLDSISWQSTFISVSSDDTILQESSTTFLDSSNPIKMKISTGWIRLGVVQGYQRAYRVMVIGQYKTRHTLRITIYNDYSNTIVQTVEFNAETLMLLDTSYYGVDTYGDLPVYGGTDNRVYQFEIHLKKQKCQAVRFVMEDIIDNGADYGTGESCTISGINVQIGRKEGSNKLPGRRTK